MHHGGDNLSLGMLSVGDNIINIILKENFQDTTSLLVDKARDTFHATFADRTLNTLLDIITVYQNSNKESISLHTATLQCQIKELISDLNCLLLKSPTI